MDTPLRERIFRDTLIPALDAEDQIFLTEIATEYDFDFEEIQTMANAARDLEMWREARLPTLWSQWKMQVSTTETEGKQVFLAKLKDHMDRLCTEEKVYPTEPLRGLTAAKPKLAERPAPTKVFTLCPYYTEEANCCELHIIEAVTGCALGCSFCNVNASVGENVEFSTDLAMRLAEVELDPNRFYHVSTSHMSDSLIWGNRYGMLDALFDFARRHPNVRLELKTKSDRIDYLLRHEIPSNILCSWWINTDTIIRNEEHATATLRGRFKAARALRDHGGAIAFHINPIVHYRGWRADYSSLVGQMMSLFSPEELDFISMGVLWLNTPVVRGIRHRGGESKVLQMPLIADMGDRLTYPPETRIDLYKSIYQTLQPWQGKVFMYLCMESTPVWDAVLGESLPVIEELEKKFRAHLSSTGRSPAHANVA